MSSCLYLFSSVADFSPQLRPQSRTRVTNLRHSQISVTRNFPYALNNLPGNAWKRPLYWLQEAVAPPTLSQNAGWDHMSFRRFAISGAFSHNVFPIADRREPPEFATVHRPQDRSRQSQILAQRRPPWPDRSHRPAALR